MHKLVEDDTCSQEETIFHKMLDFSVLHSRSILTVAAVLTVFFGFFITRLNIDPDVASLIPANEKISMLMEKYGELDEEEDYLALAVSSKQPLNAGALQELEQAVKRIQQLPKVKKIISPFNMVTFEKDGKKLEVRPMSGGGEVPESPEDLREFMERLLRDPFARRFVVSPDGSVLCFFIPTGAIESYSVFMEEFKAIVNELEESFDVYYTGSAAFTYIMQGYLTSDLSKLIAIAVLVILIIYYVGFRTKRSVILTFITVAAGTVWTLGFMALLGYPITVISIATPPLILSLGSSYSIHMLNQYYREAGGKVKSRGWITDAAAHINKTIVMAAITTVIGFSSLLVTTIEKTREFSIASSFGILACALLSLFILPAILYNMKPPTEKQRKVVLEGALARSMTNLGLFVLKWRAVILIFLVAVAVGYGVSLRHLRNQTDIISYFPKKEKIIQDTEFITGNVGGFQELKVTLTAPGNEEKYFLDPMVMEQISKFEDKLEQHSDISNIFSFVSYLKFANQTMFGESEIPEKKGLVLLLSRYMKILAEHEGSNEIIRSLANPDLSQVTLTLWIYDSQRRSLISDLPLRHLVDDIEGYLDETIDPALNPEVWGESMRYLSLSEIMKRDQRVSMLISLALIFILTTVGFKSLKFGFFSIIPLSTAIMLNFIFMVVMDIPLDMTTVMFTSVVIGVGVDNAIHFLLQYRKQACIHPDDFKMCITKTMVISGRPILLTTASIIGGLLVLTLAKFQPVAVFGLLVSVTLAATAFGTLVILPAILSFRRRERDAAAANTTDTIKSAHPS